LTQLLIPAPTAAIFDGVPVEALEDRLRQFGRRRFGAGSIAIAEGDRVHEMYVIESGSADVSVLDRRGASHQVNRVGPGDVLGEMSLFTGRPASATVRAIDDLVVVVVSEGAFHELGYAFPRLYQNLGAIVSRKLYHSDRLRLDSSPAGAVTLVDHDSDALGGYALAASLAWHVRAPVLLIAFGEASEEALGPFAAEEELADRFLPGILEGSLRLAQHRAYVLLASRGQWFVPERILHTLDRLTDHFKHVLVQGASLAGVPTLRLPPLGRLAHADEQALSAGLLPPTTAAGRTLGRAAREIARLQVGVALGAGGTKGFAHVGVLAALARAGVPIDFLAGSSVGALVGALFALGHTPDRIAELLERGGGVAARPVVSIRSLFSDAPLRRLGEELMGARRIEELSPTFAIVAADILTGEEVVFRRGPLCPAILASSAIPGVLPAQRMGGRVLVDGGIVDPVPAGVVADMGADVVLAVNLKGERGARRTDEAAAQPLGRAPAIVEVITRSIEIMQSRLAAPESASTIVIEPRCVGAASWDLRRFARGVRYVECGEAAVKRVLPHIAAALPWVRR
jgi:NTE family protein